MDDKGGMNASGLRRFLELVPDMPVAEAQEQAGMTDEEIDQLVSMCCAVLDSRKEDSLYDFTVLEGQQRLASEFVHLRQGFVHLCNAMDTLIDAVSTLNGGGPRQRPENVVPLRPDL